MPNTQLSANACLTRHMLVPTVAGVCKEHTQAPLTSNTAPQAYYAADELQPRRYHSPRAPPGLINYPSTRSLRPACVYCNNYVCCVPLQINSCLLPWGIKTKQNEGGCACIHIARQATHMRYSPSMCRHRKHPERYTTRVCVLIHSPWIHSQLNAPVGACVCSTLVSVSVYCKLLSVSYHL